MKAHHWIRILVCVLTVLASAGFLIADRHGQPTTQPAGVDSARPALNEEADILGYAAGHPLSVMVLGPDGTPRRPKYGDPTLLRAEKALKNHAKPWTVKKVLSWYKEAGDGKTRAHLLRVLAASRNPKAAIELGRSLEDKNLDVRVAATYGLLDYFQTTLVSGGSESHMAFAAKWWRENRRRLLLEVAALPGEIASDPAISKAPPDSRRWIVRTRHPGSRFKLDQVIKDGFAFIAVCEATGDAVVSKAKGGVWEAVQEFKLKELLAGERPKGKIVKLHYRFAEASLGERAIEKHGFAIWVVRKEGKRFVGI